MKIIPKIIQTTAIYCLKSNFSLYTSRAYSTDIAGAENAMGATILTSATCIPRLKNNDPR